MHDQDYQNIGIQLAKKYGSDQLNKGFVYAGTHVYTDKDGSLIYIKVRLNPPNKNEKKWIRPFHYNEINGAWIMKEPMFLNGLKPLYRLSELINNDATIWIT